MARNDAQRKYYEKIKNDPELLREYNEKRRVRMTQWRKENPEKHAANNKKHRYYAYGLTDVAIARLFAEQEGRCAICQKELDLHASRKWCIDHNHDTGQVRGILCYPCNVAIGQFQDSPAMLMRAITYLEQPTIIVEERE